MQLFITNLTASGELVPDHVFEGARQRSSRFKRASARLKSFLQQPDYAPTILDWGVVCLADYVIALLGEPIKGWTVAQQIWTCIYKLARFIVMNPGLAPDGVH